MSIAARGAVVVLLGLCLVGFVLAAALFGALSNDEQDGDAGAICGSPAAPVAGLDAEQMRNVAAIVTAGARLRVPTRADVVAVATAMQESTLRNLNGGDRDSVGLFQQRPSQGWGSLAEITDPIASATTFFRALLAIPGWDQLPLTVAAQRVQRSGLPDAYARWEPLAGTAVDAVSGACTSKGAPRGATTHINAANVVQTAPPSNGTAPPGTNPPPSPTSPS